MHKTPNAEETFDILLSQLTYEQVIPIISEESFKIEHDFSFSVSVCEIPVNARKGKSRFSFEICSGVFHSEICFTIIRG